MPLDRPGSGGLADSVAGLHASGRTWLAAEAALARAELAQERQRFMWILALGAGIIGGTLGAIVMMAVWLAAMIAPYAGGMTNAAGLTAIALFIVAFLCGFALASTLRSQRGIAAIIRRWGAFASGLRENAHGQP